MSGSSTLELQQGSDAPVSGQPSRAPVSDDKAMLKAAADLTRDLNVAKPEVYWVDMIGSALICYAGLAAAILASSTSMAFVAGIVAVLSLYRAGSFIHELTHIKPNAVPGFRLAWNVVVGIPLL